MLGKIGISDFANYEFHSLLDFYKYVNDSDSVYDYNSNASII